MWRSFKGLAVAIVLVGCGWVGATYWFGVQSEAEIDKVVSRFAGVRDFDLAKTSFERGLFQSRATTRLAFAGPHGSEEPLAIDLVHELYHGPIPVAWWPEGGVSWGPVQARIRTRLAGDTRERLDLARFFDTGEPLAALTRVAMDGSSVTRLEVPPWRLAEAGSDDELASDRTRVRIDCAPAGAECESEASLATLRFAAEEGASGSVEGVSLRHSFVSTPRGYMVGEMQLSADELRANTVEDGTAELALSGLSVGIGADQTDDLYHGRLSIGVDGVTEGGEAIGHGRMVLALRDLDARALDALSELDGSQGLVAMQLLRSMLERNPRLILETLRVAIADGDLEASGAVTLQDLDPRLLAAPAGALAAVREAELEVSGATAAVESVVASLLQAQIESAAGRTAGAGERRALQEQAETMAAGQIRAAIENGLVVLEDGRYRLAARYRDGALQVNGRPIPIPGPTH